MSLHHFITFDETVNLKKKIYEIWSVCIHHFAWIHLITHSSYHSMGRNWSMLLQWSWKFFVKDLIGFFTFIAGAHGCSSACFHSIHDMQLQDQGYTCQRKRERDGLTGIVVCDWSIQNNFRLKFVIQQHCKSKSHFAQYTHKLNFWRPAQHLQTLFGPDP